MLTAQGAWVWSPIRETRFLLAATKSSHAATEKAPCKPQRRLTFPSATTKPWCGQIIKSIKKKIFGDFTHHVTSDIVVREIISAKINNTDYSY